MERMQSSDKSKLYENIFLVSLLAVLVGILYAPVIRYLITQWSDDPNYSHGFIIPFLSAYFIWEEKDRLSKIKVEPSYLGAVVIIAGVLLYLFGNIAAELFTMRVSMVIVIWGVVILNLGKVFFKKTFFSLAFLLLMIPPPTIIFNQIAFPLQMLAAKSAELSLKFIGIPVLREGNVISLSTSVLEVAEACSGLRSLVSLITLGIVFAHFAHKEIWKQMIIVSSTIPIAILANAMRVSGTGILAYFWGEEVAKGFYHSFAGFLVFAVAVVLVFAVNIVLFNLAPKLLRQDV